MKRSRFSVLCAALASAATLLVGGVSAQAADSQWHLLGSQVAGSVDQPVWSIASSPLHSATLLEAVAGRGVLRSTDNGLTWATVLPSDTGAWTVHFDSQLPGTVYAGTYADGFWRSVDEGKTWTRASDGLDPDVRAIDSAANLIVVGTGRGVYYTTDNAATWHSSGLATLDIAAVAIVASGATTQILAGADNGPSGGYLFSLSDLSGSWSVVHGNFPGDATLATLAVAPAPAGGGTPAIYAGTSEGLYTSTDSGATWSQVGGLPQTDINAVSLNPGDGDQIYAASDGDQGQGGIFRSLDRGGTWSPLGSGGLPKNPRITALGLQPLSALQVIAAEWNPTTGQAGVYRIGDQEAAVGSPTSPAPAASARPPPVPTRHAAVSQPVPRQTTGFAWQNVAIATAALLALMILMGVRRWWMRREDVRIYRNR